MSVKNSKQQSSSEKRAHPRVATDKVFVSEKNGDLIFVSPALNLSHGGIFLKGRVVSQMDAPTSTLKILSGDDSLTLEARMVRDGRSNQNSFGAAYEFIHCSKSKELIKGLLGNLN